MKTYFETRLSILRKEMTDHILKVAKDHNGIEFGGEEIYMELDSWDGLEVKVVLLDHITPEGDVFAYKYKIEDMCKYDLSEIYIDDLAMICDEVSQLIK